MNVQGCLDEQRSNKCHLSPRPPQCIPQLVKTVLNEMEQNMHEIQIFFFFLSNDGVWEERAKIYLRSKYVSPLHSVIILPHL